MLFIAWAINLSNQIYNSTFNPLPDCPTLQMTHNSSKIGLGSNFQLTTRTVSDLIFFSTDLTMTTESYRYKNKNENILIYKDRPKHNFFPLKSDHTL